MSGGGSSSSSNTMTDERVCLSHLQRAAKPYTCLDDKLDVITEALALARKDTVEWGVEKANYVGELARILALARAAGRATSVEDLTPIVVDATNEKLLTPTTATALSQRFGRRALKQILGEYALKLMVKAVQQDE